MGNTQIDSRLADLSLRRTPDTDWSALTLGEKIRHLEVEGYLLRPGMLGAELLRRLKEETAAFATKAVSYSDKQRGRKEVQWSGGAVTDLIVHPPMIAFLKALFGEGMVLMDYDYARSEPGHPGISLHSDGQPWGSKIFGFGHSCPRLIRCLYYLDDLTPEVSPFRVLPRSHLSFHNEGNPYLRYERHPEEVMVTARAGDAILINQNVIHGNYPNIGTSSREMLAIAYRPAWAGPGKEVPAWPEEKLARCPLRVRAVMGDRNQRIWAFDGIDKPENMPTEAPGINPSRWELE